VQLNLITGEALLELENLGKEFDSDAASSIFGSKQKASLVLFEVKRQQILGPKGNTSALPV
jgi:hypothetical protein